jgi:nicotinamide-nucleotide amidase
MTPHPALARFDELVVRHALTVGVAESLTCGKLTAALGPADGAGDWLRGGIVAYGDDVKFDVLGLPVGPVITAAAAERMAAGAARVLDADLTLAVTGVGGPGPAEGQPQGTVFIAIGCRGTITVERYEFDGDPAAVLDATVSAAITDAIAALERLG